MWLYPLLDEDDEEEEEDQEDQKKDSMDVSSKLMKTRTIIISEPVTAKLAQKVITQLLLLEQESDEDIIVVINSPGGDGYSGNAIYDMMKFVKPKVKTLVAGMAASAATTITLGGEKDARYSLPHSKILIHQPSMGMRGTAADIEIEATQLAKFHKDMIKMMSMETGQSEEKIATDIKRNFWMSAEEAKDYGIIHQIVKTRTDMP
jgi:ATP-dependent Clp protease protease subunit